MNIKKKFKVLTILTGITITAMHVYNKIMYHIATINNILDNKNNQYYNSKFGHIAYTKKGNGTPILLIHDLNVCSSSYEWNQVINKLSETNTVYTIDLLGCGCSDKPNLTYTNYVYVQLVTDFIKDIIKEKIDVIATGKSSSIILMTCANDHSIINKVVLVNPEDLTLLSKNPDSNSKIYRYLINTPIIGTFIYNMTVNRASIEKEFKTSYYYDQNKIKEKDIITYFESSHRCSTKSKYLYLNLRTGYTNANIKNSLTKIDNNIYIIIGNANPINELNANQYQNLVSNIKIAGIDNTKYLPQLESPDDFVDKIINYI